MDGRESAEANPRARIAIAVGAAVFLIAIVIGVTLASAGGDEPREAVAADPECIEAWNDDPRALVYGRHNFSFHLYKGALVTFLDDEGDEVASQDGACAVVFPSEILDSEPVAAGQILRGKRWSPISEEGVAITRVAELQVLAAGSPNSTLDIEGKLAPGP